MNFPDNIIINSHAITIVPRYCETDQAGVVHHTVYPIWFEMGRTELLRANGMAYKDLEKAGIFFVVTTLTAKYRRPAYYDEQLKLTTTSTNITNARIEHTYQLTRPPNNLLLAEGTSILACLDANGKIRRIPNFMYPAENHTKKLSPDTINS